jgi:predicted nuclease of predicted toxin-antitoxin system
MRILIDECLNWRLSRALTGHYAVSAQKMGWAGLKNSALLLEAEKQFDVFITGDLNLNFQQDVTKYNIAVVVLHAESTQLHHTLPLMSKVLTLLSTLKSGQFVDVYP